MSLLQALLTFAFMFMMWVSLSYKLQQSIRKTDLVDGEVERIFICSNEGEPMHELKSVMVIEQLGLEGDRYACERGAWSKSRRKVIRQVSLIEAEAINTANIGLVNPFLPSETRRNIVVKNFPLNDFVGKEFRIGNVRMRGVELCDPCQRPSKLCGKFGFEKLFLGYGGLRAEILNSGQISIGDIVAAR